MQNISAVVDANILLRYFFTEIPDAVRIGKNAP
jgi:hypothetical protein